MDNYEPSFIDAVNFTLRAEGLLSDNSHDAGGLTKFGVTQDTWTEYRKIVSMGIAGPASVAQITVDQAIDCYHIMFWHEPGIDALPRELQGPVFDFAVNSGASTAIKKLQAILGVAADGALGPITLAKFNALQGPALRRLRNDYVTARLVYDADLAQHNANDITFIEGWISRVTKLYDFAY